MGERKSFGPPSWLYPMPVLIVGTYDGKGLPDAMTAAWGGIKDTNQVYLCLSSGHRTVRNLLQAGEGAGFTVSPATEAYAKAADYVGMVSFDDLPEGEKMKKAGLHPVRCERVDAPRFEEFPLTLECRLVSYDPSTGALVGDVVDVTADGSVLGDNGKPDIKKLKPLLFDPAGDAYFGVGNRIEDAFIPPEE